MTTDNEQTTGMGVAQRFVKAAERRHCRKRTGTKQNQEWMAKASKEIYRAAM